MKENKRFEKGCNMWLLDCLENVYSLVFFFHFDFYEYQNMK